MNKTAKFIFICLVFSNVTAQEQIWTLEESIQMGLQNSLEIKIKQIEIKRTQKLHNSIANNFLPTVSFDANQSYNFGSTIDPSTNGRVSSNIQYDNFFLGARMNLLDFNKIATSQFTKLDIDRAKIEKEVLENEYKLQIAESYFSALYTQELVKIQENQLVNTKSNLDRIEKEEVIGSKPKSDLYDMQLNLAVEEKNYLETKQLLQIQKTQLLQLLNVTEIDPSSILLMEYLQKEESISSLESINLKTQLATINYEKDKIRIKQARGNNLPSLSAFYNYSTFYYKPLNQPDVVVASFNSQFSDNKNQQVGLQLSIPIFNGFRNSKNIKALRFESEKSKFVLDQETLKVNQQVEIELKKIDQFQLLKNKLVEIKELSSKTFKTSQSKFEAGKIEAILLATVKNQLLQAEYNLLKNQLQLQFTAIKVNLIQHNQL